jgi:hypothetical protein
MNLELTDEQTEALLRELHQIIDNDRYPFSPRIRTLKEILGKLRPEPARATLPSPKSMTPEQRPIQPATLRECVNFGTRHISDLKSIAFSARSIKSLAEDAEDE